MTASAVGPSGGGPPESAGLARRGRRCAGRCRPTAIGLAARRDPAGLDDESGEQQDRQPGEQSAWRLRGRDVLEVAGRIGLDGLDEFLAGIDEPADERDDQRDQADGEEPLPEDEPEHEQPDPERPPGRAGTTDRACGRRRVVRRGRQRAVSVAVGADVVVVDAQRLHEPVEQRDGERDGADHQQAATEDDAQEEQEHADRGQDRRERRTGHVDPGRRPRRDPGLAATRRGRPQQADERDDQDEGTEGEDEDRQDADDGAPIRDDELRRQFQDPGPELLEHQGRISRSMSRRSARRPSPPSPRRAG